ncbi:MAG: NACHT domain-containing protein [Candidatus Acidiferrales bacterium]
MTKYRLELKKFHEVVFNRSDPGIPVRPRIGDQEIPLRERFVVPELYAAIGPDVRPREPAGEDSPRVTAPKVQGGEGSPSPPIPIQQIRIRSGADRWIAQARRSVILGSPGSGKSALLRVLAIELLSEEPILSETAARWGLLLPVWIPFSYWTDLNRKRGSPVALSDCLHSWFAQFDQNHVWLLVEAMEDERLLLLVDGLDEWTDKAAARTTSHILQTYIEVRNLPAVLVSRPHGFERASIQGPEWQIGDLVPLSFLQQRALLCKWLGFHRSRTDS